MSLGVSLNVIAPTRDTTLTSDEKVERMHSLLENETSFQSGIAWLSSEDVNLLGRMLGESMSLQTFQLRNYTSVADMTTLANGIRKNTMLRALDIWIYTSVSAVALLCAIGSNSTMQEVTICFSGFISTLDAVTGALGDMIKLNETLQRLCISGFVSDATGSGALVEGLAENRSLQELKLVGHGNAVSVDALVVGLLGAPGLATLDLSEFSVEDVDYAVAMGPALKTNSVLQTLSLSGPDITSDGAAALADALKSNTSLTTLSFAVCRLGPEGATALAGMLEHNNNKTLTKLSVLACSVEDGGATALAEALKTNTTLEVLTLSRNNIHHAGVLALADMLTQNTALRTLLLRDNTVRDAGAVAVSEALMSNSTLRELVVSKCGIGSKGLVALAAMLKTNAALHSLELDNNDTDTASVVALADALISNSSLERFYIGNNVGAVVTRDVEALAEEPTGFFSDKGMSALADMIRQNRSLEKLYIYSGTDNTGAGPAALIDALRHNDTLRKICFKEVDLGENMRRLASMIETNTSLLSLEFIWCKINASDGVVLSRSLKKNATLIEMYIGEHLSDEVLEEIRIQLRDNARTLARRRCVKGIRAGR